MNTLLFIAKYIKKAEIIFFSLPALILLPLNQALAVITPGQRFKNLAGAAGYDTSTDSAKLTIITNVIIYVLGFVGVFFLLMIVYSGFQWIMAGGNEEIIEKAQTRLKNSIIGFIVIAVSYALIIFALNFWKVGLDNRYL